MRYATVRDTSYDFLNQSYNNEYPNLHKYPATMLPQIGSKLLKEFKIRKGRLLDPYCGSGSSFASGLNNGIQSMVGFDINPLAILISKGRFSKIQTSLLMKEHVLIRNSIYEFMKNSKAVNRLQAPVVTNIDFWFSKEVIKKLTLIKYVIDKIEDPKIKNLFLIPFSETVRECSFTRNNEFKLYKMKEEDALLFNPDVLAVYFHKLEKTINLYLRVYHPLLKDKANITLYFDTFKNTQEMYSVVLTSPPYGDSRTTVAYGQFSTFSNEWLGIENARKIDSMLMGGKRDTSLYTHGLIGDYIIEIEKVDSKRALEVSAFYKDLRNSIQHVASTVHKNGKIFYIVGNRTVKGIQLPTDQFIAETLEQNNCKHITTIERAISSKAMPSRNSPTNERGKTVHTMLSEYIIVCDKC